MVSTGERWIAFGALLGGIGVGLGAFGAHGLSDFLVGHGYTGDDLARRLEMFETAVHYQMLHALALVLTGMGLTQGSGAWWRFSAWAFTIGIVVFSGLLKVLTFVGPQWNWLGAIVPVGGLSMIVGWAALAIGALRKA